jgi:hypothetical protein
MFASPMACDLFWAVDPLPVELGPRPTASSDADWWRLRSRQTLEARRAQ